MRVDGTNIGEAVGTARTHGEQQKVNTGVSASRTPHDAQTPQLTTAEAARQGTRDLRDTFQHIAPQDNGPTYGPPIAPLDNPLLWETPSNQGQSGDVQQPKDTASPSHGVAPAPNSVAKPENETAEPSADRNASLAAYSDGERGETGAPVKGRAEILNTLG